MKPLSRYLFALFLLLGAWPGPAAAQPEAWLVTYGPGEEMWERFGHNALWMRDAERGVDQTYSYGYFDMDRPGFAWEFARGIMIYEGAAGDPARELALYRSRDRTVRMQRLDLDESQFRQLYERLEASLAPERRAYRYDYFFENCSTRIRDYLDEVLDGALMAASGNVPAEQTLRDHTHRLTQEKFWLHSGMMMGLGPRVDRPISAWDEMFLPEVVAERLVGLRVNGQAVVAEDFTWHETSRFAPPQQPGHRWVTYGLLGLITAALILIPAVLGSGRAGRIPLILYVLANGLAGLNLLFLWFGSEHEAAWRNLFLLLANPLWWVLAVRTRPGVACVVAGVLGGMTLVGAILLAWPGGVQFRPGPLLWLVPANLAALATYLRICRAPVIPRN